MSLTPGTSIGAYSISSMLGAGGMGEVYRARDSKLDRDVALKILPPAFAQDAERVARFRREAKTLASINHPNIAHIHGLEETSDPSTGSGQVAVLALVMELVEGEDLAQRIQRGPIPIDEALPIARQIAEALEAAHEQGIVHRDLKPANIKVRDDGTVKVLDFGLAKAIDPGAGGREPGADQANSPTITTPAPFDFRSGRPEHGRGPMTMRGVILGTAAYMAPEQAKGKPVDRRADIWAFGCVLFEMLTGRRAFDGEDATEILGSIMKTDPDWSAISEQTPRAVRTLLRRCLAKDKTQRLQHIGDARIELADVGARREDLPPQPAPGGNRITDASFGAVAGAIVAAVAVLMLGRPAAIPDRVPTRFQLYPPAGESVSEAASISIAVSRDGRLVAKVVEPQRRIRVWSIDSGQSRLLDGTANADTMAFSPDGKQLAFRRSNELLRIGVDGAGLQTIGIINGGVGPIEWTDDGLIVSGSLRGGLKAIRADGGEIRTLLDVEGDEVALRAPAAVPGTNLLLYQSTRGFQNAPHVMVVERDSGRRHDLVGGAGPRYVSGFLVWNEGTFNGRVVAATFDLKTFAVGAPAPVFESNDVAGSTFFNALATSADGTIVRVPADAGAGTSLLWVDRSGREDATPIASGHTWEQPRVSPDGTRVAVNNRDGGNPDIWIVELARHITTRFTTAAGEDESPIWTRDRILFRGGGNGSLQSKPADGSANETELKFNLNMGPGSNPHFASVSPDGAYLAAYGISAANGEDVLIVDLKTGSATPFAATPASERSPMFSPDGHWIAYQSDESGRDEIYVRPFPGPGGKFQVSTNGGSEAVWNRNGRELFYREDRKLMSVAVSLSPTFIAASPTKLFEGSFTESHRGYQNYDVSPDGQRFVMIKRDLEAERVPIQVAVDMIGELRRLTSQPH